MRFIDFLEKYVADKDKLPFIKWLEDEAYDSGKSYEDWARSYDTFYEDWAYDDAFGENAS